MLHLLMRSVWGHITVRIEREKKTVHSGYFQPMASRLRASFCREVNFTDQCFAKLILEIRGNKYRPCQAGFLRIEAGKPRERRRSVGLFFSASCWPENLNDLFQMVSKFLRMGFIGKDLLQRHLRQLMIDSMAWRVAECPLLKYHITFSTMLKIH